MDVERFASELPELFDDFPRSERPRGRRFDDIVAGVPNLACENNLALINLAASLLAPGEAYVEAGTYQGASLIAAMRGNEGKEFVGIDDFSFTALEVSGRKLPAASRGALDANLERFGAGGATVVEGDALEVLRNGAPSELPIGVFYWDAAHSYEAQRDALVLVEPHLAEPALVVVDDSDWERVGRAVGDYLPGQPSARLLLQIGGESKGQPQWWEGVAVLAWRG